MMRKYPFLNEGVRRSLLIGVVSWLLIVFALLFAARSAGAQELGNVRLANRGSDSAFLKKMPWSGYWWSRREGKLAKGWAGHAESPMQRYDRYVMSRTGKNPGAQAWEQKHHYNPTAPSWWGHCNGWAAASIMTTPGIKGRPGMWPRIQNSSGPMSLNVTISPAARSSRRAPLSCSIS